MEQWQAVDVRTRRFLLLHLHTSQSVFRAKEALQAGIWHLEAQARAQGRALTALGTRVLAPLLMEAMDLLLPATGATGLIQLETVAMGQLARILPAMESMDPPLLAMEAMVLVLTVTDVAALILPATKAMAGTVLILLETAVTAVTALPQLAMEAMAPVLVVTAVMALILPETAKTAVMAVTEALV